jgi:hypothetical protein
MVCFGYIIVIVLHEEDDGDDDNQVKEKVKLSYYRPGQALGVPRG